MGFLDKIWGEMLANPYQMRALQNSNFAFAFNSFFIPMPNHSHRLRCHHDDHDIPIPWDVSFRITLLHSTNLDSVATSFTFTFFSPTTSKGPTSPASLQRSVLIFEHWIGPCFKNPDLRYGNNKFTNDKLALEVDTCPLVTIVLVSRISRLRTRVFKELMKGQTAIAPRPSYLHASYGHFQPLRHQRFCATAVSEAHKAGKGQEIINVTFVDKDGAEKHIKVPVGMSILEAAHENDIELEGSWLGYVEHVKDRWHAPHVICSNVKLMDVEYYNKLEDPTDEENDVLDLAFGLTEIW
ncbi:hypothetical protein Ancab_029302, partial [Ancistrocladus abbreviatus]